MDDTSAPNFFSASGEPPVPIPTAETAWENMLHKLEKELPTSGTQLRAATQKRSARNGMVFLLFMLVTTSMLLIADNRNASLINHAGNASYNGRLNSISNHTKTAEQNITVPNNADVSIRPDAVPLNNRKNTLAVQQRLAYPGSGALSKNGNAGISKKQAATKNRKAVPKTDKNIFPATGATNDVASQASELFQNPIASKQAATKQKPGSPQQDPIVSLTNTLLLRTGLYWAEPLPFAGSAHYFAGAPASAQRYALLVPGIWVSLTAGQSSFALELHPLATALLSDKAFATTQRNIDSSVVTTTKSLLKISGFAAGLNYHQKLGSGWWLGGGFQGNWWQKGLVETTTTVERHDAANHTTVTEQKERNAYALNSTDVPDFAKFQLFMQADLLYKTRVWEAGVRTGVTFMPLAQKEGPKNQLQASLFFRLCLLQKQLTTK